MKASDGAGWPYSVAAVLETARTSWTALLDAVRFALTCLVLMSRPCPPPRFARSSNGLIAGGQWREGDPETLDASYDIPRIAHLLRDLPSSKSANLKWPTAGPG